MSPVSTWALGPHGTGARRADVAAAVVEPTPALARVVRTDGSILTVNPASGRATG